MIGGNVDAIVQIKHTDTKNEIGERICTWTNVIKIRGWLDFTNGEAKYDAYNAKLEESSHIFICDYSKDIENLYCLLDGNGEYIFDSVNCIITTKTSDYNEKNVTSENARMIVNGLIYDIVYIDNPMQLNQHFEFYLKLVGRNG